LTALPYPVSPSAIHGIGGQFSSARATLAKLSATLFAVACISAYDISCASEKKKLKTSNWVKMTIKVLVSCQYEHKLGIRHCFLDRNLGTTCVSGNP
jgi:hypothetical protein